MIECQFKSDVRLEVEGIHLEVGDFEWPSSVETKFCLHSHQLSVSLTPRPRHAEMRYDRERDNRKFTEVGDLMFFPASTVFNGRSNGGHQRLLICNFGTQKFNELRQRDSDWTEAELDAGLDLKDPKLRDVLMRLAQESMNPGFASEMLTETLMLTALIYLARYLERSAGQEETLRGCLAPWQMRRIRERVEHAEAPAPTVGELAKLCGISARHLMRGFKNLNGITLHGFVEEIRLGRAKKLLIETDLPLKSIAWELGFIHSSSFCSAFRRALGMTPSEFRAQFAGRNKSA